MPQHIEIAVGDTLGEKSEAEIAGPGVYQMNRPESFGAAPALLIVRVHH